MPNNPWYEMYAVNLMLFSPTKLGRAWTGSDDRAAWHAQLDALDLSQAARDAAKTRMENLSVFRPQAEQLADALKADVYGGSEPHPPDDEANAIIKEFQVLDASREETDRGLSDIIAAAEELAGRLGSDDATRATKLADAARRLRQPRVRELPRT